mmetsp:Transcript_17462/g.43543  ORF Transcript_17462/g.43543 Transcript_17462/m.43543 type:complete len:200 (-) Transcript_17462:220-819(-)
MIDFIEMSQTDLCSISLSFLGVLTGNLDVGPVQMPPVGETLTVIQSRVKTFTPGVGAVNVTVLSHGCMKLKCVSRNLKTVGHIFPLTSSVLEVHPVPIGTVLPVRVVFDCAVTNKVDGRHSVVSRTGVACLGTPSALIFVQSPSDRTFMLVRPSFAGFKIVACNAVPFRGTIFITNGVSVVEAIGRNPGKGSDKDKGTR